MKAGLFALSLILFVAFFSSCSGPEGPPGPQGLPGPQGPQGPRGIAGEEAYVFEYSNVDFEAPEYGVFLPFPDDFQARRQDAVLVYALWYTQTVDGEEVDVWRLLPQSVFLGGGELVYNYEHTYFDVEVFLEADFDFRDVSLGPEDLEDWVIRIVVVPGQELANGRKKADVDFFDYEAVKEFYGLSDFPAPVSSRVYKRPELK